MELREELSNKNFQLLQQSTIILVAHPVEITCSTKTVFEVFKILLFVNIILRKEYNALVTKKVTLLGTSNIRSIKVLLGNCIPFTRKEGSHGTNQLDGNAFQ